MTATTPGDNTEHATALSIGPYSRNSQVNRSISDLFDQVADLAAERLKLSMLHR